MEILQVRKCEDYLMYPANQKLECIKTNLFLNLILVVLANSMYVKWRIQFFKRLKN